MTDIPSSIFLVDRDNALTELRQTAYASEALLQKLLADHPALLSATSPSGERLLLIRREFGVPGEEGGSDRWALDHLFIDHDGVPVLVEVKRASDTRARREVVAQMLDYAANGVTYWPIERIVASQAAAAHAVGNDPDAVLAEFLDDADPEAFWKQVEANLRAGRVRLVFVADRIAPELRRIVEFLNEQMRPAEVLAVEVEHFANPDGARTLVPRLLGQTERAQAAKTVRKTASLASEEEWLIDLEARHSAATRAAAERVLAWFEYNQFAVGLTGSQDSMCTRLVQPSGRPAWPFFIRRSSGRLETALQNLRHYPAFAEEHARHALLERLKAIPGLVATTSLAGWPGIPLEFLNDAGVWEQFKTIALEVRDQILRP